MPMNAYKCCPHCGCQLTTPQWCYVCRERPDLLSALRGLLQQVDTFCEVNGEADFETAAARAAVAKADGR